MRYRGTCYASSVQDRSNPGNMPWTMQTIRLPPLQHELDHTDEELSICPERSKSWRVNRWSVDDLSDLPGVYLICPVCVLVHLRSTRTLGALIMWCARVAYRCPPLCSPSAIQPCTRHYVAYTCPRAADHRAIMSRSESVDRLWLRSKAA